MMVAGGDVKRNSRTIKPTGNARRRCRWDGLFPVVSLRCTTGYLLVVPPALSHPKSRPGIEENEPDHFPLAFTLA
jgi:hypothetical protein